MPTNKKQPPAKPHNGGKWSEAEFRAFVLRALRRAKWGQKYECLRLAYRKSERNPKTGKMRKLHECAHCHGLFPMKEIQIDHITPVYASQDWDWNKIIARMFCELDGLQALCEPCHEIKTLCDNHQVTPDQAAKVKAIHAFKRLKAKEQIAELSRLKLSAANTRERIRIYTEHINQQ